MLSLTFFVYPSMHTAYIGINKRKLQVVAYKRLKKQWKIINLHQVAYRRRSFREVDNEY